MASVNIESGFHSPRISFSVYLSQTDMIKAEKPEREEDLNRINSDRDFEFCRANKLNANGLIDSIFADELFVEGAILPQIRLEDVNFGDQYTSEVRIPAAATSNPKDARNNVAKAGSRQSSRWPFTRSRRLFSSLKFYRSKSAGESKSKLESAFCCRRKSMGAVCHCEDFKLQNSGVDLRECSENEGESKSFGDIYGKISVASYGDVYGMGNVESCGEAWKSEASAMDVAIGGNFCFCAKFY